MVTLVISHRFTCSLCPATATEEFKADWDAGQRPPWPQLPAGWFALARTTLVCPAHNLTVVSDDGHAWKLKNGTLTEYLKGPTP